MRAREIAGITVALGIGYVLGGALMLKDLIEKYVLCEDDISQSVHEPVTR